MNKSEQVYQQENLDNAYSKFQDLFANFQDI